jgi:hypothetical protein
MRRMQHHQPCVGRFTQSFLNHHRIVELDSVQSFISVLLTALVNLAAGDSTSTVFSVQSAGTYYDQLSRSFPAQSYCLGARGPEAGRVPKSYRAPIPTTSWTTES